MSPFERDLRESLRRREPPQGFAEAVLARARATEKPSRSTPFSRPFSRWVAVAAMAILMVGGFVLVRQQRRQAAEERQKEQLIVALRITGSKLRSAQEKLSIIPQHMNELQLQQ